MKTATILTLSAFALTLSACSKKDDADAPATTAAEADAMASDPSSAVPAASAGQTFADTAAASDAFEIETSRLAADKAQSARIKSFAAGMIKAHTDSTAKLAGAAAKANPPITPAATLNATQQATLDTLRSRSGADFDTAYAKAQVDAHQMTLDALKAYAASGDVPSLKTFAGEMVPVVTGHLNMAKGL